MSYLKKAQTVDAQIDAALAAKRNYDAGYADGYRAGYKSALTTANGALDEKPREPVARRSTGRPAKRRMSAEQRGKISRARRAYIAKLQAAKAQKAEHEERLRESGIHDAGSGFTP